MKINTKKWQKFKIEDLFSIKKPSARSQSDYDEGKVAFVASGNCNNGVLKFLTPKNNELLDKGNCITVSPVDGSAFYQKDDFLGRGGAGSSILILYNDKLNLYNGYFISTVIKTLFQKYHYSNMLNGSTIKKEIIILPITSDNQPDWQYMEDYMKKLEQKVKNVFEKLKLKNCQNKPINIKKWNTFEIDKFFVPLSVKNKLCKRDITDNGCIPIYSSKVTENGIEGFCCNFEPEFIISSDTPFYVIFGDHTKSMHIATKSFLVMDNVKVLKPLIKNKRINQFICSVWQKQIPNLGYSRHWEVAKSAKIKLPISNDGNLDFEYMEQFIKNVENKAKNNLSCLKNCI